MSKDLANFDKNKPPVDQLNVMGVNVAVWEHEKDGKKFRQVTLKKKYKDSSGELKETHSFSMFDLPVLIQELQNVYAKEIRKEYENNFVVKSKTIK